MLLFPVCSYEINVIIWFLSHFPEMLIYDTQFKNYHYKKWSYFHKSVTKLISDIFQDQILWFIIYSLCCRLWISEWCIKRARHWTSCCYEVCKNQPFCSSPLRANTQKSSKGCRVISAVSEAHLRVSQAFNHRIHLTFWTHRCFCGARFQPNKRFKRSRDQDRQRCWTLCTDVLKTSTLQVYFSKYT